LSNLPIQSARLSSLHIYHIYHSVFLSYFFHKILLVLTFTVNNFVFTIFAVIGCVTSPVHHIITVPYVCQVYLQATSPSITGTHYYRFGSSCLLPNHS
jgi:hypothetical protein